MKCKLLLNTLALSVVTLGVNLALNQQVKAQEVTFLCSINENGSPTTVARTPQGDVPIVVWETEKGGGYTPQRRCEIVSAKFQDFHSRGILKYMTTGRENRLNVICVATREDGPCEETLYTISDQKADPGSKLQQLLDVRLRASGPISETHGRIYIDMNQFLRDATASGLFIPNSRPSVNPLETLNNIPETNIPSTTPEPINNQPLTPLW
jgi:hypothetical protein